MPATSVFWTANIKVMYSPFKRANTGQYRGGLLMNESKWYEILAERSRQETIAEYKIHSKHWHNYFYNKDVKLTDCPCVWCHKSRRNAPIG